MSVFKIGSKSLLLLARRSAGCVNIALKNAVTLPPRYKSSSLVSAQHTLNFNSSRYGFAAPRAGLLHESHLRFTTKGTDSDAIPKTRPSAFLLAAAAIGTVVVGSGSDAFAHFEDGESTPPWTQAPRPPLNWSGLVRELSAAQSKLPRAPGFSAHRRRRVRKKIEGPLIPETDPENPLNSSNVGSEDLWEFKLEFSAASTADLFDIFSSLMNAFSRIGPARVSSEELATRTTLRAVRDNDFELTVSTPRFGPFDSRIVLEIFRQGSEAQFSATEVAAILRAYEISQEKDSQELKPHDPRRPSTRTHLSPDPFVVAGEFHTELHTPGSIIPSQGTNAKSRHAGARQKLEELGAEVFTPKESVGWSALAGYDHVKSIIEESIILPVRHPEVYEGIVRGTREKYESVLPRAILFTGPPGCGKTTVARILSSEIGIPFVNLRLESLLSKYYGETTKKLAEILDVTRELGPCVVFCDEIDSLGCTREGETHEVTRRTLSVLLRHLDGLEGPQESILVAATNMPGLLDPALISRFDVVVSFDLPDATTRAAILGRYAKQLSQEEKESLAALTDGFSGRELRDACEAAERAYAGRVVRLIHGEDACSTGDDEGGSSIDASLVAEASSSPSSFSSSLSERLIETPPLPTFEDYLTAIARKGATSVGQQQRKRGPSISTAPKSSVSI